MVSVDAGLIEAVAAAEHICCLTGAGISAESGVPTFRGAGGLWRGQSATDLATPESFARQPARVWAFYHERRAGLLQCTPNAGHRALVQLEHQTADWTLVTQNIDGLHAGAGSRDVIELHGSIWTVRCTECPQAWHGMRDALPDEPRCSACGAWLRPGVVWFGETLPAVGLETALAAALRADIMLVVGTSGIVQPAASLAAVAAESGARVVEVNLEPTPLSDLAHDVLTGPAAVILPKLLQDQTGLGL